MEAKICSSERKSAYPSIIKIASSDPARIKSNLEFACSSSVGLTMNLPSTMPILTAAIGLMKGTSDMTRAAEAAQMARGSGERVPS